MTYHLIHADKNCMTGTANGLMLLLTVLLCGKQNISLRGHEDANSSQSANKGNFKALLEFRALEDQLLQKHVMVGAKNAQYTSADTQNEIILICKSLVLEKIAKDVEESGVFSIIRDECTDIANHEQLSLSLRYVARESM